MPIVMANASDFGIKGNETSEELNNNKSLLEKNRKKFDYLLAIEMGMGDVSDKVIPKFALLSKSCNSGTITSRYFTPKTCHETHAATGTNCIAAACLIKGTVAAKIANVKYEDEYKVVLEHPLGSIECIVNTFFISFYP
jgi:2-methylaconitate cis-trans-isomerase PrpF